MSNVRAQTASVVADKTLDTLAICAEEFSFSYPYLSDHDGNDNRSSSDERGLSKEQSQKDLSESVWITPTIGPLNWHVQAGAFQLIVGATGSGKTTLLRNTIPSLIPAGKRSGTLKVFGIDVSDMSVSDAAALIGYVAQSPENQIVCDSVWHELAFGLENLGIPQEEMHRRVAEVAHFFGIESWFHRDVSALSDGQKQIVALASVMASRPRLVLLDEPTAQLDPVAEKNFLHALFRINRELGVTVVVATHSPETMATYATDAVEIQDGCIKEIGLDAFALRSLNVERCRCASRVFGDQDTLSPAVMLTDAYVRYRREDNWVLRGCDFEVNSGQVSALVGGNGSGKTTLLNALAGVTKLERGRMYNALLEQQALLPQDPKALFACDTVDEELHEWQSGCGYTDEALNQVIHDFSLENVLDNHPFDLSGGQQQMLALAKLLLTEPDLLLLDEPTKGLDAHFRFEMACALDKLRSSGTTIVMATHDLSFAALVADDISMLFDGVITCTEPTQEFFINNLFYYPLENGFTRLWEEANIAGADANNVHTEERTEEKAEGKAEDATADTTEEKAEEKAENATAEEPCRRGDVQ